MEGDTPRQDEGPSRYIEPVMQITRSGLQRLTEEAGRNAIAQDEKIAATPIVREAPRRQLFREREIEREHEEASRDEPEKGHDAEGSVVGSSEKEKGKVHEWFTSLPSRGIETFEQLVQKFTFHFASKRKQKRSATYMFNIRQREDESLKNFIGRFNNETLEVQDLRIDMIVSILIHGLKKGPLASALARDPPEDIEQLMKLAQKYIDEEEINAMKDGEWQRSKDRGRWRDNREKNARVDRERDPPYKLKYRYTPLATTRAKALMMVEKSNLLQWSQHTRFTPAKKYSSKYCKFHKERGHDTEECYQLKDKIERLVRQGYFKEYKLERDEPGTYKVRSNGDRSRSRSRDRFRGRQMESRKTARDNVPVKGVINTIAGGPRGGDSKRSRKQSERVTREDRRKE
ncbi:UNVERIFIED_CONTAM: hypothetical protein Sradi_2338000 [Sesamum radiatum]|uniref:Retrotransposon gag domain-containing protein n=1 Tax=Sesamum radiatum TaxID=300843 RepID=A0AAW2T5R3_SESRA